MNRAHRRVRGAPSAPDLTRRGFLGATLAAGGAYALGGCSDTAASGAAGGTLRVAVPTDVNLATAQRFQAVNQPLRRTILEYVVDRRPGGGHDPYLARDWEFSDDQLTLVINLRDDVVFHDGRPFVADDVIGSIRAATDPDSGAQSGKLLARASNVRASGRHQLTVDFDSPFLAYLDGLAMMPVIDPDSYDQRVEAGTINGTGPFVWDTWRPGTSLDLRKNPDYWQPDRPYVDRVGYDVVTDPQAMLAAVRSESVDLAMRVVTRDAASIRKDNRFEVQTTESYEVYVGCNVLKTPLDDVRVRQAIAYSLDRERICDQVYRGLATPSCVPWAEGTPGVTDEHIGFYDRDLDRARSLVAEAGVEGTEIPISNLASEPTTGAVLEIVAYNLEEIGLVPSVEPLDAAQFETTLTGADFGGLWITDVALTAMGQATALLTANPLLTEGNSENFTEPGYAEAVGRLIDDSAAGRNTTEASAALTDYMLEQAFHNSIAQVRAPIVTTKAISGTRPDLTLAIDLTDVRGVGA